MRKLAALIVFAFALAGCGGGSTGTVTPSLPASKGGILPQARRTATPSPSPSPSGTPAPTPTPTSTPVSSPPPAGFVFSQFKDITVGMNWHDDVLSTNVTGTQQTLISTMPAQNSTVTWAFATGQCGSESWAGTAPSALVGANVQSFVNANKYYIISTGGAAGVFTCPTTSAFLSFIQYYYSSHMLGVDFDIESTQTQADVDQLVADVQAAEASYPNMRFSFTIATEGGTGNPSLNATGLMVVNSIKSHGLGGNYTVDLMTMDYGGVSATNCVVVSGACEMGQSADQAALDLNAQQGIPLSHIEITPMIGQNNTKGEVFTLADAQTVSSFALQNGLAGVHFWSFDRDTPCSSGKVSSSCNGYPAAGALAFTNTFVSDLGL